MLPSELRILEDVRRCKCDPRPAPSPATTGGEIVLAFCYVPTVDIFLCCFDLQEGILILILFIKKLGMQTLTFLFL